MSIRAFLFDAEGRDREIALKEVDPASLDERLLLWIDLDAREAPELERVTGLLELDSASVQDIQNPASGGALDNYGAYFQFSIDTAPMHVDPANGQLPSENDRPARGGSRLDFVVGARWLLTVHDGPIPFLDSFREQDKAETVIGQLSPQTVVASLLDWHLGEYFAEVSRIEATVDKLDERVLTEPPSKKLLSRIVAMRRRVSRLRNLLVPQRSLFYGLSRPDFALISESGATPFYSELAGRFERAVDEVERTRDVVVGSFELFTSRTSQQTNDLVRVLTFVTVVIGFCAAVAGFLGMNFDLPFFQSGYRGFMLVLASLAGFAIASMLVARWRGWL